MAAINDVKQKYIHPILIYVETHVSPVFLAHSVIDLPEIFTTDVASILKGNRIEHDMCADFESW